MTFFQRLGVFVWRPPCNCEVSELCGAQICDNSLQTSQRTDFFLMNQVCVAVGGISGCSWFPSHAERCLRIFHMTVSVSVFRLTAFRRGRSSAGWGGHVAREDVFSNFLPAVAVHKPTELSGSQDWMGPQISPSEPSSSTACPPAEDVDGLRTEVKGLVAQSHVGTLEQGRHK